MQGRRNIVLFTLLFIFHIQGSRCACPDVSGALQGFEHNVAGTITISEDCTLKVSQFSYDGGAPQAYWWISPSCDPAIIKNQGTRISDVRADKSYNKAELSVPLKSNIDWSNIKCILLYCEEFYADLGQLKLAKPVSVPANSAPAPASSNNVLSSGAPAPAPAPMETLDSLPNCMELLPGYYNLYWGLNGDDTVTLGFEGRPGNGDFWIGFGFSLPNSNAPTMIGGNVVIGGFIGGQCFGYNYHLSSKSQCDFATGDGVCPDFAGKSPLVPSTSVKLLSCEKMGDKLVFVINRPLGNSDGLQNAWPTDGSQYSIFAMGPVSEGSNATVPVVLYHNLQLPGTTAPQSVTTNLRDPIKLNFSTPQKNCRQIVPLLTANAPNSGPQPAPARGNVSTVDGPTTFAVTIGSNKNYPNPPAWGYSLWVNGKESPVVVVRRGTKYTFKAEAGPTHPVYITTSIIGGGLLVDFQDETIFAGNTTTFGTVAKPKTFTWTPDENTPDLVYYQCAVHQKLGWEIKVLDAGSAPLLASDSAPPPESGGALVPNGSSPGSSSCTVTVQGVVYEYEACIPVNEVGSNYFLAWSLIPLPNNNSNNNNSAYAYTLKMAMNSTANNGYVALAFPQTPGQMVGSLSMILSNNASTSTGASILPYALNAQSTSGVVPTTELNVTDNSASFANGVLAGRFQVDLPQTSRRRSLLASSSSSLLNAPPSAFPLIFSAGGLSSSGALLQHTTTGTATLDLTAAETNPGDMASSTQVLGGSNNPTARTAHMWLMVISFGVLVPVAILIIYWFPPPVSVLAFRIHLSLQVLAFAVAIAGIAAGFVSGGGWNTIPEAYYAHRDIGVAVIVMAFVQMLALVWRPALDAKIRKPWALGHRWWGRITVLLAIANIYYGIIHVANLGAWAWAIYTVILVIILLLALGKPFITKKINKKYGSRQESEPMSDKQNIAGV